MNPIDPTTDRPGFKSFPEVKKALGKLKPPVTEELRQSFLQGIAQSPQPKQIAFRLLSLLVTNQAGNKAKLLSFLQSDLTAILAGSHSPSEELTAITSLESVQEWVHG